MTKEQTLMTQLAEPFPVEMEKTLVKSGISLIYLPVSEVINRLNKVLGPESWSFDVISIGRDQYDTDEIIAHVNLSVDFGTGRVVSKHGMPSRQRRLLRHPAKSPTIVPWLGICGPCCWQQGSLQVSNQGRYPHKKTCGF